MNPQVNIEFLCQDIFRRKRKLIGWGTGSVFRYFLNRLPVQPVYLVDNNPDMWGKRVNDIPVFGPDKLLAEDPEEVAVVIYSSFVEQISEQIRTMGKYLSIAAGVVSGYEEIQLFLNKMSYSKKNQEKRRPGHSSKAVVIQGPVTSLFNVEIIKHYVRSHPNDHVILSTWEATNPLYIKELENVVDELILNTPPSFSGYQNRNYQITSTLAGLRKAQELGASQVLKTRTDIALLSENVLEACDTLRLLYDNTIARDHGLSNRIIVPETYTRKYMLYHPGDLTMYGDIQDMIKYWSTPHDARNFSLLDADWRSKNIKQMSIDGGPAESYLARNFAQSINRPLVDTLQDSWQFLRDFFIVVDNSWLDIFWTKYPRLTSIETHHSVLRCISHCFWHQLYFKNINLNKAESEVDIHNTVWGDFCAPSEKTN